MSKNKIKSVVRISAKRRVLEMLGDVEVLIGRLEDVLESGELGMLPMGKVHTITSLLNQKTTLRAKVRSALQSADEIRTKMRHAVL